MICVWHVALLNVACADEISVFCLRIVSVAGFAFSGICCVFSGEWSEAGNGFKVMPDVLMPKKSIREKRVCFFVGALCMAC